MLKPHGGLFAMLAFSATRAPAILASPAAQDRATPFPIAAPLTRPWPTPHNSRLAWPARFAARAPRHSEAVLAGPYRLFAGAFRAA